MQRNLYYMRWPLSERRKYDISEMLNYTFLVNVHATHSSRLQLWVVINLTLFLLLHDPVFVYFNWYKTNEKMSEIDGFKGNILSKDYLNIFYTVPFYLN